MISRRQLLLTAASALLLPRAVIAGSGSAEKLSWQAFQQQMNHLAENRLVTRLAQQEIVERGMQHLKQLDIHSPTFKEAVEMSYESGNRYWLWQRLMKSRNINGCILNISSEQLVQLHAHPGATGMVRVISGEVEAWQFDEVGGDASHEKPGVVELIRYSHRILKPGDMAVLTPEKGNIHALRSLTKESSMLDFFIPPYQRSERHWFEPLAENWFDQEVVSCRKISQQDFADA